MSFDTIVASRVAAIHLRIGVPVTWTPIVGPQIATTAIVSPPSIHAIMDAGRGDTSTFALQKAAIDAAGTTPPMPHDKLYDSAGNEWEAEPGAILRAGQWEVQMTKARGINPRQSQ